MARLKAIVGKAAAGPWFRPWPPFADLDQRLAERWQEFEAARRRTLPGLLARLAATPQREPLRVEGRTIFRFAHPLDPPSVWLDQRRLCAEARQRLLAGEGFAAVAAELSQGGSREYGGTMGRRFLDPAEEEDRLLAELALDTVSPVIRTENGFRLFRLTERAGGETRSWAATPWPARRILFRRALNRALAGGR